LINCFDEGGKSFALIFFSDPSEIIHHDPFTYSCWHGLIRFYASFVTGDFSLSRMVLSIVYNKSWL
jgi:hypothetical protein